MAAARCRPHRCDGTQAPLPAAAVRLRPRGAGSRQGAKRVSRQPCELRLADLCLPDFQTAFGANVSLALLLSVALYYWLTKRKEASVYDDIARLQAETAAKLDALHGRGDGRVSEIDMAVRKTQFSLRAEDASIVTYAAAVIDAER